jgi:hypothetical protein
LLFIDLKPLQVAICNNYLDQGEVRQRDHEWQLNVHA